MSLFAYDDAGDSYDSLADSYDGGNLPIILSPATIQELANALWAHPNAVTFMRLLGLR